MLLLDDEKPPLNHTEPIHKCSLKKSSINSKVNLEMERNYYDIPITEDYPDYEVKICKYLQLHNVRMAGPNIMLGDLSIQRTKKTSDRIKKTPSLLQMKRRGKLAINFVNLEVDIGIPIKND